MTTWLKFLNIFLVFLIFPASSLLLKDYLVYKSAPQERTAVKNLNKEHGLLYKSLNDYAFIIEGSIFPSSVNRLTEIDIVEQPPVDMVKDKKDDAGDSILKELSLRGTIQGLKGYAVFNDRTTKKEEIFKIGDKVFEAGILRKVDKEAAIILYGEKELPFTIAADNVKAPSNVQVASLPPQPQPQPSVSLSSISQKVGEKEWIIDQRAMLKALEDMNQVLTDARLTPNMVAGKVEGFQVREIKPRGIFDALGLKNGDILIRVNNYDIDTPEKAIQVLSGLRGETTVDLDLIRGGQKMSFNYQMR